MDLSIIIVNWNSKDYLEKCIASILSTTFNISYEIIVVDNASYDGSDEMLRSEFPQVRFIQSDNNFGFAKANNIGSEMSCGRSLLFLNPDTEIQGNAIQILLDQLESSPRSGIVGAKLLNSDGSLQTSCVQSFPTILNQVLDTEILRRLIPRSQLWGIAPIFNRTRAPAEVDVVSGACLMIRRTVFETVGMFSSEYFMYSEDVDLCFKIRKTGWRSYYVPSAVVVHHGGASSSLRGGNTFSGVMMLESRRRFFRKTRPAKYLYFYRLAMFCTSLARIASILAVWPILWASQKNVSMSPVLRKWIDKLRWCLGLEKWVKNY